MLVALVVADVEDSKGFEAVDNDADEGVGDIEGGFFDVSARGSGPCLEVEGGAVGGKEHEGAEFGFHEAAGLAGNTLEDVIEPVLGDDGLAHIEEGFELVAFDAQVVDFPCQLDAAGGIGGEALEFAFGGGGEGVEAGAVDVKNAGDLAAEEEGHGHFRKNAGMDLNVAALGADVADAQGFAGAGDPAGDALADTEFGAAGGGAEADGGFDIKGAGVGVEQHEGAAIGMKLFDGVTQDAVEEFLGTQEQAGIGCHGILHGGSSNLRRWVTPRMRRRTWARSVSLRPS